MHEYWVLEIDMSIVVPDSYVGPYEVVHLPMCI